MPAPDKRSNVVKGRARIDTSIQANEIHGDIRITQFPPLRIMLLVIAVLVAATTVVVLQRDSPTAATQQAALESAAPQPTAPPEPTVQESTLQESTLQESTPRRSAQPSPTLRPPSPQPAVPQSAPANLALSVSMDTRCTYKLVGDSRPAGIPDGITPSPGALLAVTAQNRSEQEAIIDNIRVAVRRKAAPPATGELVSNGCWQSPLEPRQLSVDFDASPVQVRPAPSSGQSGYAAAPAKFPFKVSQGDPEMFAFGFQSRECDCTFDLVVDWVSDGVRRTSSVGPYRIVPVVESLKRK
jgi:hypothetical protein